jgi:hypothetical protein
LFAHRIASPISFDANRKLGSAKEAHQGAPHDYIGPTLKGVEHGCEEKSCEEKNRQEKNREKEGCEEARSEEEDVQEEGCEEEVIKEGRQEEIFQEEGFWEEILEEGLKKETSQKSGAAQARDEVGPDEAHGSRGHPGHHAADQADELTRANPLDSPKAGPEYEARPDRSPQAASSTAG